MHPLLGKMEPLLNTTVSTCELSLKTYIHRQPGFTVLGMGLLASSAFEGTKFVPNLAFMPWVICAMELAGSIVVI